MKVLLILERTWGEQITEEHWRKEREEKVIEVEIPDIDNKEQNKKGQWYILGYCEKPEEEK